MEIEIKKLDECITGLEVSLLSSYSAQSEFDLLKYKQEHLKWVNREEILACQKSHVKWLAEGDENSRLFHETLQLKKRSKKIDKMFLEDGSTLASKEEVHDRAISFFQNLLTGMSMERNLEELELLQPVVSSVENNVLCVEPTLHEIKQALLM